MSIPSAQITTLLKEWSDGEEKALGELWPLVFEDLRRMASRHLQREQLHTLQSTALINEVFVRLLQRRSLDWPNRSQFFGFVAKEMRRVLVDYARKRKAGKRGGGQRPATLDEALAVAKNRDVDLEALDDALEALASLNPELGQVVEMKFFVGLTHEEIAEVMGSSKSTVRRQWQTARTWLYRELATNHDLRLTRRDRVEEVLLGEAVTSS